MTTPATKSIAEWGQAQIPKRNVKMFFTLTALKQWNDLSKENIYKC